MPTRNRFIMACFTRSGDDNFARALENHGLLDFYALGTRRGARGIPPEHTRLQPLFGLANYILARTFATYQAESLRFRTYGLFDRWVQSLLTPGQHFFTGYAFAPGAMKKTRAHGGRFSWTLVLRTRRNSGGSLPTSKKSGDQNIRRFPIIIKTAWSNP